ncbi:tRNA cyclic N6-threonylcarbamoyladenosine(37) synthase TcdA [Helicobacter monodelphidis]|uniref:ThiF family adenylyltransferase n=1 Tax=Helicobacter sp. 15-1451 TaxID=2004995 RepID=UPI000DCC6890|nr:ThiF family adenylyltransferase [Helicobacter sp. 15-1451]RAX59236.1 tRNA cyclic N6-threonylcarbamoyladenosine(37) synthase TcdA [Helicobacter sp. 15-1451]
MAIEDRFSRTRILMGDEGFLRLQKSSVLILGVGGVGSFALDCLYRSGIGRITIVDCDYYDVTNQNRQIGSEAVGESKVEVLSHIYKGVIPIHQSVDKEFLGSLCLDDYSIILDCIDDIDAKVEVANWGYRRLFSSMGSAKRLNPLAIRVDSVWKCYGDRFARKFREKLKKTGFKGDFKVVFSSELPHCKNLGSFEGVTGSFGFQLASETIRRILKKP